MLILFLFLIFKEYADWLDHHRGSFIVVILRFLILFLENGKYLKYLIIKKFVYFDRINNSKCDEGGQKAVKIECVETEIIQANLKHFPYDELE